MPTQEDKIIDKGFVSMDMLNKLGLEKIHIRLMPASKMYKDYLRDMKLDVNELKLKKIKTIRIKRRVKSLKNRYTIKIKQ
jgi:hypothetical protein